jgi:hypothetical protein
MLILKKVKQLALDNKEGIENFENIKDNLKTFYILSIFIVLILVIISLIQHNFFIMLLITVLPVIYIFLVRRCINCGKKMKRIVIYETVYYCCFDCKKKIELKIGLRSLR